MKMGLCPRRKLFQTQAAWPPTPQMWSVSSKLTLFSFQAGGSSAKPSARPGEIHSAGLASMLCEPLGTVAGIADRMLFGFGSLMLVDGLDHPPVPVLLAAFVDDFVEDVVQVIHRVDHLADVGGLERVHLRVAQGVDAPAQIVGSFDLSGR